MRDPYDVLGVSKKASDSEIKKAFRSLAKKHHPDTHQGDSSAQKRFQEISAAYDILGDKEKRGKFDRGEIDANGNPRGFDPGPQGGFRGGPFGGGGGREQQFWDEQGGNAGQTFRAEDIFSEIFGGGGGGRRRRARKGQDIAFALTVGFEEAARGGTQRVHLPDGKEIDVRIPVGVRDGQQIRLKGQGMAGAEGAPAGDLLFTLSIATHPYLTRDGSDLKMDLPITLREAVLGGKVNAPTLTGSVSLTVPANSNSGAILRLKGKGVPAHGSTAGGDLYVRLVVTLPDRPDSDLKAFVSDWPAEYDPRTKLR
ncbi:MAG TPA: J domain-containing protein [Rhizomicrobium sp.]